MSQLAVQPEQGTILSPQEALLKAFNENPTAEMAKQIVELQQSMERFQWEREERQAKIDFDDALNQCQKEIETVVPNRNRENGITWADYKQIDNKIRPIYTKAGFSLSFSEAECSIPGKIKIVATLSKGGIKREFEQNITPGGNSKMSASDSDAAANSRAQRYLVLKIFNIAVGIAADEDLGDISDDSQILINDIKRAKNEHELTSAYREGAKQALALGDKTLIGLILDAKKAKVKELKGEDNAA